MEADKNVELLRKNGFELATTGQFAKALETFDAVLKADGRDLTSLRGRAHCLEQLQKFQLAEEALSAALKLYPNDSWLLNKRGWWYLTRKQFDKAVEAYEQTLAVEPNNEDALVGKVDSLRMQPDLAAAEAAILESLRRIPKCPQLLNEHGLLYYQQRKYDQAIEVFDQALAADSNNENAFLWKIKSLRVQSRFDETGKAIETALIRLPKSVVLLNERGWLYFDQKQFDKAVEAFEQTLAVEPNNELAWEGKVLCYRLRRNFKATEKAIEEALNRLPASLPILNQRGWLYFVQSQYDKAIETFEQVLRGNATNEAALQGKIRALRVQRKFVEAGQEIESSLTQLPKCVLLLIECGYLYSDQKQYDKAVGAFEQILVVDANNEDALEGKIVSHRMQRCFGAAEKAIEDALGRIPQSIRVLNQRGWLHYEQRQFDKAVKAFDDTLAIDSNNTDALEWRVVSRRMQRDFEGAEKMIEEALNRLPNNARILSQRGWLNYDQDKFDEAQKWFAKGIESDAEFLDSYFGRVETLTQLSRFDEALKILQQLKDSQPNNVEIRSKVGWFYLKRKELVHAKNEFDFMLKQDPRNADGANGLGAFFFDDRQYEESEEQFRRAREIEPKNAVFHANLAWALIRQEKEACLKEAERCCRDALTLDPTYAQAYGCLGVVAFKRERFIEAEDFLQSSVRVNPKKGNYLELGVLYMRMGRYDEAEKQLLEARKLVRTDAKACLELGNLYYQTDRIKEAIRLFREAQTLDPTSEEPPRAQAIGLMHAGDTTEAERILRKAIRVLDKSRRWQLYLSLSQLLAEKGDKADDEQLYEEALREVGRAIDLKPTNPDPQFHAGVIRFKLQDYSGALKCFKKCLELDQGHFDAERNIRLIKSQVRDERTRTRATLWMGPLLAVICLLGLAGIWFLYLHFGKDKFISETTLTVLSPILLGLAFVAFLLPWLIHLKLPGVEAELSQPKEKISKGPMGTVGFGASAIGLGPR